LTRLSSAGDGCVEPKAALPFYERASAFYAEKLAAGHDTERWRARLALLQMVLGRTHLQAFNLPAARASFQQALALYEGLQRESTGSQQRIVRTLSAQLLRWLAETESAAAHYDAALDAVQRSIDGYEVLRGELPYVPDITANLGESYLLLGRVLQQKGELTAAVTALQKSRSILTPLHTADPHHSHLYTLLARNFLTTARIHQQRGEQEAAQAALTSAAALSQRVTSESLLVAQDVRTQVLLELGRKEEARPLVEHLVALGWHNDGAHRDFAQLVAPMQRDSALP